MKLHNPIIVITLCIGMITTTQAQTYTQLNPTQYRQTFAESRSTVQQLLNNLAPYRKKSRNTQLAFISEQLANIPYNRKHGIGEGDWQPNSWIYKPGAIHLNQNPVYRFDYLDCQTLVQVSMALLYSQNLNQFDKNILKISYGAAGNPNGNIVRYYNRNHFVDADFNPINERNGWLTNVTSDGNLAPYAKTTTATLTRQNWFLTQQNNLANTIYVLDSRNGNAMANRFQTVYADLDFPHFDKAEITIDYIPKFAFLIEQSDGTYIPNQTLLDSIPTPAIAEIVSDAKKWIVHHETIKAHIGTELNIPHLGLLYRKTFREGDIIYRHITCRHDIDNKKVCTVTPIICQQTTCNELMFAHATDGHPDGHYWYAEKNGNYVCAPTPPSDNRHYTTCNRVENIPLIDYLTDYQYGRYRHLANPAILGIHFEKLE
jgi:hypothetical protein